MEVTSEQGETTTTYANADGTVTTELSAGPVRIPGAGGLLPVDPTLVSSRGGLTPKAAKGGLRLSPGRVSAGAELASLAVGSGRLTLLSPWARPAPDVHGDTATYADVTPGADLRVTATTVGLEVSVLLRRARARR